MRLYQEGGVREHRKGCVRIRTLHIYICISPFVPPLRLFLQFDCERNKISPVEVCIFFVCMYQCHISGGEGGHAGIGKAISSFYIFFFTFSGREQEMVDGIGIVTVVVTE